MTASPDSPAATDDQRVSAREINDTIRYTCWAVFARSEQPSESGAPDLEAAIAGLEVDDVTVRGLYDVSGMRADADLMVWLHGPTAESVQNAVRVMRRTFGARLVWSAMALHRPAEFNKGHVPNFMTGSDPLAWVCVYPFVRSYDWYLLPEEERRAMLVEHGMMGRDFMMIKSNTVAAFALGDWEWILALESPELHEIVDMMRALRSSQARRHVREEVPFYTGHLVDTATAIDILR